MKSEHPIPRRSSGSKKSWGGVGSRRPQANEGVRWPFFSSFLLETKFMKTTWYWLTPWPDLAPMTEMWARVDRLELGCLSVHFQDWTRKIKPGHSDSSYGVTCFSQSTQRSFHSAVLLRQHVLYRSPCPVSVLSQTLSCPRRKHWNILGQPSIKILNTAYLNLYPPLFPPPPVPVTCAGRRYLFFSFSWSISRRLSPPRTRRIINV